MTFLLKNVRLNIECNPATFPLNLPMCYFASQLYPCLCTYFPDRPYVQILPSSSTIKVYTGQTGRQLSCQVTKSNPPVTTYTWYRNSTQISNSRDYTFSTIQKSDVGKYDCEGRNTIGNSSRASINLDVQCK